ncbi:MAG: SMP-30/gluconolactonase/LRE family protein [SAR202 cluster bacterium]|nr:SMP-30/gluconolactonase/LRE family protein [SAR202 cluster bacterium]
MEMGKFVQKSEPKFEIFESNFKLMINDNSQLMILYSGAEWSEGPVFIKNRNMVVWSDIPNDRMLSWTPKAGVEIFRSPSGYSNGNFLDLQGQLLTCEHGNRRISRTNKNGEVVTIVDNFNGKKLNSPNDLVVKSDGSIWFTDPPYGILSDKEGHKSDSELEGNFVFRYDPIVDKLTLISDDFDKPNGIAFSPDEKLLYIADSGNPKNIRVFNVSEDGESINKGRVFAEISPGVPDGFRVDTDGNVFTSASDGIQVFTPSGVMLGKILVPERTANCAFGGKNRETLFITASTSLYSIAMNAKGA